MRGWRTVGADEGSGSLTGIDHALVAQLCQRITNNRPGNAKHGRQLVLARATVSGLRDERISTTEMHYLVATPAGVEHFVEHHELYLFTNDEMRRAFEDAGLGVDYDSTGLIGRGLWICSR